MPRKITITLPDSVGLSVESRATESGLSLSDWLRGLVARELALPPIEMPRGTGRLDPAERAEIANRTWKTRRRNERRAELERRQREKANPVAATSAGVVS